MNPVNDTAPQKKVFAVVAVDPLKLNPVPFALSAKNPKVSFVLT